MSGTLSAKAKQAVIASLQARMDQFISDRDRVADEDGIAGLDMDISYINSLIDAVKSWPVKMP